MSTHSTRFGGFSVEGARAGFSGGTGVSRDGTRTAVAGGGGRSGFTSSITNYYEG